MYFEVHVHLQEDEAVHRKLNELLRLVRTVIRKETEMAGELDALQAEVTRNTEVDQSAIALLVGIKAALDAAIASGDPNRILALSAELGTSTNALAAAVAANTPVGP